MIMAPNGTQQHKKGLYLLLICVILCLSFVLRIWDLSASGIQNDEQIWHERSARFIQSFLGPWSPGDLEIPKVYWPILYVDMTKDASYPFSIKMPAIHPGTPISFLMGLSYLFLADKSSSLSLGLGSIIEVARYPGVLLGTLFVLVVYLGGYQMVGPRAALWGALIAAVEPLLVGHSRLAMLDMSGALWISAAFFAFVHAQQVNKSYWAMIAGIFAGLALATNTYGVFLLPTFIAIKMLLGKSPGYRAAEYSLTAIFWLSGLMAILGAMIVSPAWVENILFQGRYTFTPTLIGRLESLRFLAIVAGIIFIVIGLLSVFLVRFRPDLKIQLQRFAPDRLDWTLLSSWAIAYIAVYPNLWPNPVEGLIQIAALHFNLPHTVGEASSRMPVSHWFYILRSPEHVLPWVIVLAFVGLIYGFYRRDKHRSLLVLLVWGVITLVLFSLPPGRKSTKNFLQVMPIICLLAGLGVHGLINIVSEYVPNLSNKVLVGVIAAFIGGGGVFTVVAWWPYPLLYTWPWQSDPQTHEIRELIGTGEGIKEAMAYIQAQQPNARVACWTGENNAAYYYDSSLLGNPQELEGLNGYDWVIVLPKLTFGVSDDDPRAQWVRANEPDYIVNHHQIELVRLYRLRSEVVASPDTN